MPNVASVLKTEIARVARKELRAEITPLKKTSGSYRNEIAAMKRRLQTLEQQLKQLAKGAGKAAPPAAAEDEPSSIRFSAKSLISQRRRLGLSAAEFGQLIGASGQTIYNWERGEVRPRARHLGAFAALRKLGRKEARARLEAAGAA